MTQGNSPDLICSQAWRDTITQLAESLGAPIILPIKGDTLIFMEPGTDGILISADKVTNDGIRWGYNKELDVLIVKEEENE